MLGMEKFYFGKGVLPSFFDELIDRCYGNPLTSDPDTTEWTAAQAGYGWFNTTERKPKFWDGDTVVELAPEQIATYLVFEDDDGLVKALNGHTREIQFKNTQAHIVLQDLINAHVNPIPTFVYCKGVIELYDPITLTNKSNFTLVFERLRLLDDDAQIIIQNKSSVQRTTVEASEIYTKANYSGDAIYLYNARSTVVKVGYFQGTGRTGSAIKVYSDSLSLGIMDDHIDVGRISGYDKGLWLVVGDTEGYISTSDFHVKFIVYTNYGVKAEARTTGGLFNNNFWVRFGPINDSAIGIHFTGKCKANTFWDYEFWDAIVGSKSYYADSHVELTRFIGGMICDDYFDDSGYSTSILESQHHSPTTNVIFSKLACLVQHIEHHTGADTLSRAESDSIHTNLGAGGAILLTLPQDAEPGDHFEFVVMTAQQLQIDPGAAGAIYINGAKQTDNKYVWADDEGESVKLVADGNGDWIAIGAVGTWGVEV